MTQPLEPKDLEAAARAIYREWHGPTSLSRTSRNYDWNDVPEATRQGFRRDASAAVSAYLAAAPSDELWIGEYMLRRGPTNGIWIGRRGGEGGQFATDDVERVIAQFYRENF